MPRPSTAALATYISNNSSVVIVDLFTFSLPGGGFIRYTSLPGSDFLSVASSLFPSSPLNGAGGPYSFTVGPTFLRSSIKQKVGVEPQFLEVHIAPSAADTIGTLSWWKAASAGLFDDGFLEMNKFFFPAGNTNDRSLGAITWFYGKIADMDIGRTVISMRVGNIMNVLKQRQLPRRIFASVCSLNYGGAMCGYDRVLGKNALGVATGIGQQTITAAAGSNLQQINASFVPTPADVYNLGTIIGVTGPNTGYTRSISGVVSGNVHLTQPFFFPPAIGNTFHVLPGCNHTVSRCNTDFNNLARYGGFPYIPPPEAAA